MESRGRAWQVLLSLLLLVVCIIVYALLIILFVSPKTYNLDSLVHPQKGNLTPTVAVGLLSAVLGGATSALVTRCVEQSLWITFAPKSESGTSSTDLTVAESRRLAQWTSSPLQRLTYFFGGFTGAAKRSWLLRVAGPLLIATAIVSPVLLAGISQEDDSHVEISTQIAEADQWTPYMDAANVRYRGGSASDNPHISAALFAMRNLEPPSAPVCNDTASSRLAACSVSTRSVAIRAECRGTSKENTNEVGSVSSLNTGTTRYCTGRDTPRETCVELTKGDPACYANFTSGYPPCDADTPEPECPGAGSGGLWGLIFGVWVNGVDITEDSENRINFVDCVLKYGNITITQNGTSTPELDRSSFSLASSSEARQYGYTNFTDAATLNRVYTDIGNSPYDFELAAAATGSNTAYKNPVAFLLLGTDANNDAQTVARQIEANFDMATLHAFARMPNASDITYTARSDTRVYVYDPKVLLILLVPLFATLLGCWGRWKVAGEDVVVGYDPVGIARLGPVTGLSSGSAPADKAVREGEDAFRVWRWQQPVQYQNGATAIATGFAVGSPAPSSGNSPVIPTDAQRPHIKE
ncbi:hypothetical protein FALBO_7360 [Fusarium albosuccineum]|uniref:Uncharacterized protein n=1 Tax=Fusarium albosuccineum TaxID=1237068 RepID=A0A8H4LBJ9_9HYPO|nr:hypothetical protein FALBO_7360 [Fusarium albosuccineum]